ncbi:hypothetical protein JHK86_018613 [Glycine max]|nr:hypothetical protein JHK86_018613 [Glycine max]
MHALLYTCTCNMSTRDNPVRNFTGSAIGCFTASLGIQNSFVEIMGGAIFAIELATSKGWKNLWQM